MRTETYCICAFGGMRHHHVLHETIIRIQRSWTRAGAACAGDLASGKYAYVQRVRIGVLRGTALRLTNEGAGDCEVRGPWGALVRVMVFRRGTHTHGRSEAGALLHWELCTGGSR